MTSQAFLRFLKLILLLALAIFLGVHSSQAAEHPNIVLIMADDLGWTDLGCTGSRYYETVHIDRLARQGVTFDNYYVCQNCAPTRAALISGQYAPRTGVYTVGSFKRGRDRNRKMVPPKNETRLPLDRVTLAQSLKRAGYATGMFGKWHLGTDSPHHPASRGFDEAIVSNRRHFNFKTNPPVEEPIDKGTYLADFLTDRAVDFIDRHQDEPFFLYLPHFAVHTPIQAKQQLIARYKEKEPVGGHNNPVYAAMIHSVDESVGRVVSKLEEVGLGENSLVIFTSDNGGLGGYEVPGTNRTKGITDNAPLRGGKGTLYEGGIRVPLIARWPAVVPPGGTCGEPIVHVDLYPTFVELAGGELPADYPLDGVSFANLFESPAAGLDRDAIFWHFPGYLESYIPEAVWRTTPVSVIRSGDFKLMEFFEDGRLELYNLKDDLSERRNMAEALPEKTRELHRRLVAWRKETGALMARPKTSDELADPQKRSKAKGKKPSRRSKNKGQPAR